MIELDKLTGGETDEQISERNARFDAIANKLTDEGFGSRVTRVLIAEDETRQSSIEGILLPRRDITKGILLITKSGRHVLIMPDLRSSARFWKNLSRGVTCEVKEKNTKSPSDDIISALCYYKTAANGQRSREETERMENDRSYFAHVVDDAVSYVGERRAQNQSALESVLGKLSDK